MENTMSQVGDSARGIDSFTTRTQSSVVSKLYQSFRELLGGELIAS
jgi:hypothetical protein